MATLFRVSDPRGYSILCTVERFQGHILEESEHEELRGHENSVRHAIADPMAIYQSGTHTARQVYYGLSDLPYPFNRGFVRVIVDFGSGSGAEREGWVVTAHFRLRPREDEVLLWAKIE